MLRGVAAITAAQGEREYIVGNQWGAKQSTGSAAVAYTYHQTFTVEATAHAFRFKLLNVNINPMTVSAGAVAVSNKLGSGAERYTPSSGTWVPITWDGATSVTIAAGATDRPTISWSDWIPLTTLDRTDGETLPVVMVRLYLPAGNFSLGNYNFTPWAATSGINNGRFLYMYRNAGDFASGNFTSMPGVGYTNPLLMGFEYKVRQRAITISGHGDSITEGAVNAGFGNFGNGWLWQSVSALRSANPGAVIGYVNNGMSSSTTATFLTRLQDFIAAECHSDIYVYSAFSPNDGAPSSSTIATEATRLTSALAAIDGTTKPAVLWTPCVNTAAAWNTTADGYRLAFRDTLLGLGRPVFDIETAVSDGATPARFTASLTTDGTHPNEAGHAAIAAVAQPVLQALL